MGELYKEMGFINSGHTVQAALRAEEEKLAKEREELIRQEKMITRSFGGILFIDEAYGLYKEDSRDYGSEVIEMLVKFMSRMGNWIDFPDYDEQELLEISGLLAGQYSYNYPEAAQHKFNEYMAIRKEFPYFSNARTVRNAMERARRIAATRILTDALDNGTKYTMDEIQTFQEGDFQLMIDEISVLPRDTMLP